MELWKNINVIQKRVESSTKVARLSTWYSKLHSYYLVTYNRELFRYHSLASGFLVKETIQAMA
jgi:hypothetical protein